MELSVKTIDELRILKDDYERLERLFDLEYLCSVFDIMECEDGFRDVLSYEIFNESKDIAYTKGGRVFVGLENALLETESIAYECGIGESDIINPARNMFMLYILFHEFTHISQNYGFSFYPEVNELFLTLGERRKDFMYILMNIFGRKNMIHERHANTHSLRLLLGIYESGYLNSLLGSIYYSMVNEGLSKKYTDKCINMLKLKGNDLNNLPLLIKLDLGLSLTAEEMKIFSEIMEKDICYTEKIKELKILDRK